MQSTMESLLNEARLASHDQGYRVGRTWLTKKGASYEEAYQLMHKLAMEGIGARYSNREPLLNDQAAKYLTADEIEQVRELQASEAEVEEAAANVKDHVAPLHAISALSPSLDPQLDTLSTQLRDGVKTKALKEMPVEELLSNAVRLGQIVGRAHATLGAYLSVLEERMTPELLAEGGFVSFKHFIEDQIPVGYTVAIKLMRIAQVYQVKGGLPLAEIEAVPYTKLYAAINMAQEVGAKRAIKAAASKTLKELENKPFDPNPNTGTKGSAANPEVQKIADLPTTGNEAMVFLDESRYPLSLVQLLEAQRERIRAAAQKLGIHPTPMLEVSVVVSLLSQMSDQLIEEEVEYLK
jgi:hypothetical protein